MFKLACGVNIRFAKKSAGVRKPLGMSVKREHEEVASYCLRECVYVLLVRMMLLKCREHRRRR